MRVGYVGMGIMGRSMALNLKAANHEVVVYNRTVAKAQELLSLGFELANTPRELAEGVEVVLSCVTDDAAVGSICHGDTGLLAGIRPSMVYIDLSTVSPLTTKKLATEFQNLGVMMLDAPVTGGDRGAREGTLTIMVGGDKDAYARVYPLFTVMGKRIYYVGPSGSGQTLKLINNMMGGLNLIAAAEGLSLAAKSGLPAEVVSEVLMAGSADSVALRQMIERAASRNLNPGFSVANRLKDLRLALALGQSEGVSLDLLARGVELYQTLLADGLGDLDQNQYLVTLERKVGHAFKPGYNEQ